MDTGPAGTGPAGTGPGAGRADVLTARNPAETVLIGHSVGCQALVRYLAVQPPRQLYAALMLVAGWVGVDRPWPSLQPWLEPLPPLPSALSLARRRVLVVSDNDPYTTDHDATVGAWRALLDVTPHLLPGRAHLNDPDQEELFTLLAPELPG